MKIFKLTLLVVLGNLMVYMTYQSKYESSFLDVFYWFFLVLIWIILLPRTLYKEVIAFKNTRKLQSFSFTFISIGFILIITFLGTKIHNNFNKPTLLKVHYDGDTNGVTIDFKTDGTFIFDSYSMGFNWYLYGNYTMNGDTIILDKKNLDNVIKTNKLEIREIEVEYGDTIEKEKYLYQISDKGNIIDKYFDFRVITDNRKENK